LFFLRAKQTTKKPQTLWEEGSAWKDKEQCSQANMF
jgi:hypothetical protein